MSLWFACLPLMNNLIPFKELKPAYRILACILALLVVLCCGAFFTVIIALSLALFIVVDLYQVFIETPFNYLCGLLSRKRKPS